MGRKSSEKSVFWFDRLNGNGSQDKILYLSLLQIWIERIVFAGEGRVVKNSVLIYHTPTSCMWPVWVKTVKP